MCIKNNADIAQCDLKTGISDDCKFDTDINAEEIYGGIEYLRNVYNKTVASTVAWCKLYKSEIFEGIEFPVGRIYEDTATIYKLLYRADKIVRISNGLYYYFKSPDGISRKPFNLKKLDFLKSDYEKIEFFKKIGEKRLYEQEQKKHVLALFKFYYQTKKYYPNEEAVLSDMRGKICQAYKLAKKSSEFTICGKIVVYAGTYIPYLIGMICEKMKL